MASAPVRRVRVLTAGGTISMCDADGGARPALDAAALVAAVPALGSVDGLEARDVVRRPGWQMEPEDALAVARAAREAAAAGRGVVITHGTDTIEETAMLCDLLCDGDAPVVVTGAIRPASAPGTDGPANLLDAVHVAGSAAAAGLGALVVFAGEVHAARAVRKVDAASPRAFGSPRTGPLGTVADGAVAIAVRPGRRPAIAPAVLGARVPVISAALGEDGAMVAAALGAGADGLVAVALGAGHFPPVLLTALEDAARAVAVVVTLRPERGPMLRATYAGEGSERAVRGGRLILAPLLSPAAARIKLMACLGAGLEGAALREAFAPDDGV